MDLNGDLFQQALFCLQTDDPRQKCQRTDSAYAALCADRLSLESSQPVHAVATPGRPLRPRLVRPRDLPRRKLGSTAGRATLLHALAHIEFNAINLAWDAVYRFRGLPADYYCDWARIAYEEALHFRLLCGCLESLGYAYGDFDAHNGLWEMACKTAHDPLVRMALVPRVLEARGLDVTPGILARFRQCGDACAEAALEVILHDEIGHVEVGSRWFRYLCGQRGLNGEATFAQLLNQYTGGQIKPPLDHAARRQAGFNEWELQLLEELALNGPSHRSRRNDGE